MSHIVTIQTKVHDPIALTAACRRLNLPAPVQGVGKLYSGEASGICVILPQRRYPVVVDTVTGTLHYDNFGGHWGQERELDRFMQAYAVEKARLEARRKGHSVTE